jgi:hypothetical protein
VKAALGVVVAMMSSIGCPGSLEDPERFRISPCDPSDPSMTCTSTTPPPPPTTEDIAASIFLPRCALAGCHAPPNVQGDLELGGVDVESRLFAVTSSTAICNGRVLVVVGNADASLLFGKLAPVPPCGSPMPLGSMLSDAERGSVRAWIESL